MPMKSLLPAVKAFWRRLRDDRRGNVLMILGFSIIPLTLATGMAVDYAKAARLQTKLNAAADAAALLAVSKQMMLQTNTTAQTAAYSFFDSQAANLPGLSGTSRTVTITGGVGASNTRTAVVTYTANSSNAFSGVLGMSSVGIGGTSTATSSQAPNIDFYVMLDTSPSMLLPATSAGLATQIAATGARQANGRTNTACAFACHQTDVSYAHAAGDLICDSSNTTCIDYYRVARNNSLVLRTDLVTEAVQNLTDVATSTATSNGAHYRMGLYQFDYRYQKVWPTTTATVDASLSTVKTHVTDAQVLTYCLNNQRVCGTGDNDTGTNFTAAFTGALGSMPTAPGQGTNVAGDTPMALLFIVTDGMRDELSSGSRFMGPIPTSQCDTIKARGIRIAVLHTEYLPESASDSWSITNVKNPYLSPTDNISPALISCASPGLYYQVTTDSDITAALAALFQRAVATAHLIQ